MTPIDDSMVMSFDLDAGKSLGGHGMDEAASVHLNHTCISFKEVTGTGKKAISFAHVPLDKATAYAAEDAEVTWRLWHKLSGRLPAEGATRVYQLVDRPLIPVVAGMERQGIKVDREALSRLSGSFSQSIAGLEAEIHELAGHPFTIGSPQQLGVVLFDEMGLKGGKKGKSGTYSTDVTVLEKLKAEGSAICGLVLEWRQLSKLKSTYTDALQQQINRDTGRVHTSYSLTGAQTGRLSSTDPNLQNIPIRTEIGRQIRHAFVAEPGNVILAADYSQIELRLAAHMADVPALKDAFEQGEDIHNRTAMELFGEVNRDTRGRAKTINFAILYGISRWGLAGRLEISADEAQDMISRYYERFPGISVYINETLEKARANGFTETLFGRKMMGIKKDADITETNTWVLMGAGLVGALAYTFSDSFWFSAVEAEVYAMSSFFTAIVVWAAFKWELVEDEATANRWILFIAYLVGLSIGVHLLNLVTLPELALLWYFKKEDMPT